MKHKYIKIEVTLGIYVREDFEAWFGQCLRFAKNIIQQALVKAELLRPDEEVVTITTRRM